MADGHAVDCDVQDSLWPMRNRDDQEFGGVVLREDSSIEPEVLPRESVYRRGKDITACQRLGYNSRNLSIRDLSCDTQDFLYGRVKAAIFSHWSRARERGPPPFRLPLIGLPPTGLPPFGLRLKSYRLPPFGLSHTD